MQFSKSDYKEYPKTLPADDLWGQVRRTVNGKPVGEDQIRMMVEAIQAGLDLQPGDHCLDIACGNGALSSYLFDDCASLFGVDYSPYLIDVARSRFARPPRYDFLLSDAATYARTEADPTRFDKALCYGSFSFLPEADAHDLLETLNLRFSGIRRIFIGNLPDKDRAHLFYPAGKDYSGELSDHAAQIGIWRNEQELAQLAGATGWRLQVVNMPAAFYASHYRFDAILERAR